MSNKNQSFITKIHTPSIMLFVAGPESGKTHLIKYMMYRLVGKGVFVRGIVFCPTYALNNSYNYIPESYVYPRYEDEYLKNFLRYQRDNKQKPAFLILDDCIGSLNFNSKIISHLFTCYRHYNLTIFLSTQYIYKIPPVIRECATFAFIFFTSNMRSIEALQQTYFTDISKDQTLQFITNNCNEKGKFILVLNQNQQNKYIISKAPAIIPKFFIKM